MQYRYVAPSSHFVRNGVSLDFRVASLLKIQFAFTTPFGELPRWGAKNVLPLNLIALPFQGLYLIVYHFTPQSIMLLKSPPPGETSPQATEGVHFPCGDPAEGLQVGRSWSLACT